MGLKPIDQSVHFAFEAGADVMDGREQHRAQPLPRPIVT
jgi:hypothetical protein